MRVFDVEASLPPEWRQAWLRVHERLGPDRLDGLTRAGRREEAALADAPEQEQYPGGDEAGTVGPAAGGGDPSVFAPFLKETGVTAWASYPPRVTFLECGMALEEIAVASPSLAVRIAATWHAVQPLILDGTADLRAEFMPSLEGGSLAAFAVTEPQAGSDIAAITTSAEPSRRGWVLHGEKSAILNADRATFFTVLARCARQGASCTGRSGLAFFVIPATAAGLRVGPPDRRPGLLLAPTASLLLDRVEVPHSHLVGEEGAGYLLLMQTLDRGRAFSAGVAVGVARGALEHALAHARRRRQFGRPLSAHQAVAFTLAEMATAVDAARLMALRACALVDAAQDYTLAASMAKLFATEVAEKVTAQAMNILGRFGYEAASPVAGYWRDAKALTIMEGTSEVQKMVIASQF